MECFVSLLPRARFTWSRGRDDSLPIIITCVNDGEGSVGERRMGMADERTSSSRGAAARKGGGEIPAVEQRCTSAPLLFSSSNLFWPGFWSRKCCSLGIFNTSMLTFLVEFFEVDHLGFVACFEIIKIFSIVPRRNRTRGKVTIVGRERSIDRPIPSNTVLSRHQICLKIASFPVSRYCQFKWRFLRGKALSCFPPHFGTRPNKMTQIQRFPVLSQFFPSFPR